MVFTEQTGLSNLYSMVNYCINNTTCKRKIVAQHFNDTLNELCNGMCDYCKNLSENKITNYNLNFINEVKCIAGCLDKYSFTASTKSKEKRLTANKLSELAFIDVSKRLTLNKELEDGSEYEITSFDIDRLILTMISREFLKEDFHFTPYNTICYIIKGFRSDQLENETEFKMSVNLNKIQNSVKIKKIKKKKDSSASNDVIVLEDENDEDFVVTKKKRKTVSESNEDDS